MLTEKNIKFKSALAAYKNGQYLRSVHILQLLEKEQPDNWLAKYHLGNAKLKTGKKRMIFSAISDFQRAKDLIANTNHLFIPQLDKCIHEAKVLLHPAKNNYLSIPTVKTFLLSLKKRPEISQIIDRLISIH
ncbi:hypothetical protein A9P82_12385 [Arachidicoccus ginsenosidimutans]|uniref:tetratricopeptide repeat protein n=1 Tax=Arachidicoccus sp. BS20 TaxID=1850526 RepID=UPI0007F072D4|nr:tetratricopeptide repeat protein [Arachidicoccus sp. BS20]ANI90010.1 hypothetical protein A9P82_12385 [Arachidicoccus sp. BS20]